MCNTEHGWGQAETCQGSFNTKNETRASIQASVGQWIKDMQGG